MECDIEITHPEWMIFADETGCNTNMKADGQYGGTQFCILCGTNPKKHARTSNHCFTLFPFVAMTGESVVYVIIFNSAAKKVQASWDSGFDIRAQIKVNEKEELMIDKTNCQEDGFYQEGKSCNF